MKRGDLVSHNGKIIGKIVDISTKFATLEYNDGERQQVSLSLLKSSGQENVEKLVAGKDFGKYRSPIKENQMGITNRLEKLIVKEEETMVGRMETPIQSTGSTPEPVKNDVAPPTKEEPKKEEPKKEESEHEKKFKEQLKAIMKKVKENQTVEWKNLIDLLETFEKTDLNKE